MMIMVMNFKNIWKGLINKVYLKDELNEVLIANKLIQASREDKDMHRVECELGCCHEIDSNKFMGYVVVDTVSYNYVFNKNYNKVLALLNPTININFKINCL